jgi:hypothetical protein
MKKGLISLLLMGSFYFVSNTGILMAQEPDDQAAASSVVIPDGDKDDPGTLE